MVIKNIEFIDLKKMAIIFSKNEKSVSHKGFSLVELLVAIFIFSLMITVLTAAFSKVIIARKKTKDVQKSLEVARTAVQIMAKDMRNSTDLKPNGNTATITMFSNFQEKCLGYRFYDGRLQSSFDVGNSGSETEPNCASSGSNWKDMIPSDVSGSFIVIRSEEGTVGKVTINMAVGKSGSQQYMQTTVSFRDYENSLPVPTTPASSGGGGDGIWVKISDGIVFGACGSTLCSDIIGQSCSTINETKDCHNEMNPSNCTTSELMCLED